MSKKIGQVEFPVWRRPIDFTPDAKFDMPRGSYIRLWAFLDSECFVS